MHENKWKKPLMICFSLFLFLCLAGMLSRGFWSSYKLREYKPVQGYVENPWVLKQDGKVLDEDLELPEFMQLEKGKTYTLSTSVTYDGSKVESPYMFFHLDHAYTRVSLDGEVLFSYLPDDIQKMDRAHSPGFIYKEISLPKDCKGKRLDIEILPLLDTKLEYGFPDIVFGDFTPMLLSTFNRDIPQNIIIVLCILVGICAILFSTATLNGSSYLEGITIGIFSLLFALYLITETKLNVFYIGNPYYTYLLNYITFSLLPIALMGFMKERMPSKQRIICKRTIAVQLVLFGIEMILHFGGWVDLREMIPFIHLMYFLEVSMIIIFISFMKDMKRKRTLIFQLMPIIFGMFLDGIIYWLHLKIGSNDATFTILGVIIFLIVELFHVATSSVSVYTESIRSRLYRQMAYIDEMSNTYNRRSYEKEIGRIISKQVKFKTMRVVSLDVNDLKFVNDHYGHAAGDLLISSAAKIMLEVVGNRGKVFRTGGDEFFVFLYDVNEEEYKNIVKEADLKKEAFNAAHGFVMSLAVGCVVLCDNNIIDAVKEADKKMYIDKASQKID